MFALFALRGPVERFLSAAASGLEQLGQGAGGGFAENFRGLAMSGDPAVVGVLIVLSFCAIGIAWALLVILARGVAALFGGPQTAAKAPDVFARGERMAMAGVPVQARLEDGPNGAQRVAAAPRESRALLAAPLAAPGARGFGTTVDTKAGSRLAAAVGRPMAAGGFGLDGVAALPPPSAPRALPYRKISLTERPRLADVGRIVQARPEWTGKVTPMSMKEAGAVEQGHIATRQDCAETMSDAVREKDFKLFSLPRVDAAGRTQPDLAVFSVTDHGILPRGGMEWPAPKRTKRD